MLRFIAGVIAVITALGGYMSWKYSTTDPCQAARQAVMAELPEVIDDLADEDPRFRALRVARALLGRGDGVIQGVALEFVDAELDERGPLSCAILVAQREVSPAAFRATVADRLRDRIDEIG